MKKKMPQNKPSLLLSSTTEKERFLPSVKRKRKHSILDK